MELLKLSSNVNECKPLPGTARRTLRRCAPVRISRRSPWASATNESPLLGPARHCPQHHRHAYDKYDNNEQSKAKRSMDQSQARIGLIRACDWSMLCFARNTLAHSVILNPTCLDDMAAYYDVTSDVCIPTQRVTDERDGREDSRGGWRHYQDVAAQLEIESKIRAKLKGVRHVLVSGACF